MVVRGGFMEADGYRAMKKLLAVKPRTDAVFAANDPSAIGAMKAIWEAGLRVPDDIAIVGAGDIALGDLLRVPLTHRQLVARRAGQAGGRAAPRSASGRGPRDVPAVVIPPGSSCGGRAVAEVSAGRGTT